MNLLHGDCLEKLKDLSDNSVDIIIADPPFSRFKHLKWDRKIDFEPLWEQLWRVSKPTTPIFLFGDFKFAVEIYNSQPKYFKYEIVWNKKTTTTPLLSRKRFGKCTEYILVFYKKQPVYNYLKYHKLIKKPYSKKKNIRTIKKNGVMGGKGNVNGNRDGYIPKLPTNIIDCSNEIITNYDPNHKKKEKTTMGDAWNGTIFKSFKNKYDPKLPLNIISNDTAIGSDWCGGKWKRSLKVYEPRLPTNIIENEIISDNTGVMIRAKNENNYSRYEPRLPTNVICCNSKRNKKIIKKLTEKPQFVLKHLLKYFSNEGDTCLDFCMGSGSMGIACIDLKRKFIGIEKNKEFFDITKERLLTKMTKNE